MYRSQRAGSVVRAAKEIVPTRGSVRTSLQSDTKVCHVFFCVMRTFGVAIRVGPPRPQRGSAPAPQFSPPPAHPAKGRSRVWSHNLITRAPKATGV